MSEVEKPDYSETTPVVMDGDSDVDVNRQKFLTFILGDEEYGIEILKVQEIRGYDNVTRIPGAPAFIKGVSNLRGLIVPIVDMRIKLGLGISSYDSLTVVIILNINGRLVGIVVGSVSDVITLGPQQIQDLPNCDSALPAEYLLGLSTISERMVILINVDKLMTSSEMALMDDSVNRL